MIFVLRNLHKMESNRIFCTYLFHIYESFVFLHDISTYGHKALSCDKLEYSGVHVC